MKVICGRVGSVEGPVRDIITNPECLDVTLAPNALFSHAVENERNAFAYLVDGQGTFDEMGDDAVGAGCFVLVSGKPLQEPVAWYGPIVMNTEEELQVAFQEYQRGAFIKSRA